MFPNSLPLLEYSSKTCVDMQVNSTQIDIERKAFIEGEAQIVEQKAIDQKITKSSTHNSDLKIYFGADITYWVRVFDYHFITISLKDLSCYNDSIGYNISFDIYSTLQKW